MRISAFRVFAWGVLAVVLLVFAMLTAGTVHRQGIGYDEQTDLDIARVYWHSPDGWWQGSASDAINVRLPTYTVPLVGLCFGHTDLLLSRLTSVAVACLTLVIVFLYAKRNLGRFQAVVALCLLGTSPYFLAHGRVALTESDIFVCCGTALLLLATATAQRKGCSVGRAVLVGTALGLALSAKVSAVALIPATVVLTVWKRKPLADDNRDSVGGMHAGVQFYLLLMISQAIAYGWWHSADSDFRPGLLYGLTMAVVAAFAVHTYGIRRRYYGRLLTALLIVSIAATTFLLVPPVHTYNPAILNALAAGGDSLANFRNGFFIEAGSLHFLTTVLRPGIMIGSYLWLSVIRAILRWRTRPQLRLPLAFFGSYFAFLLTLPSAQPFYMVPVFPIMAILAADWLRSIWRMQKSVAVGVVVLCVVNLAVDLALCFPDYNLNGYQIVGQRYVGGRSSVGYRCVIQTPNDGLQQALEYVNNHADADDTVVIFDGAKHIVSAVCPDPVFEIVDGTWKGHEERSATFVVTLIGDDINECYGPDWPTGENILSPVYDLAYMHIHFRPVFEVKRRFGLTIATVWQRKADTPDE